MAVLADHALGFQDDASDVIRKHNAASADLRLHDGPASNDLAWPGGCPLIPLKETAHATGNRRYLDPVTRPAGFLASKQGDLR